MSLLQGFEPIAYVQIVDLGMKIDCCIRGFAAFCWRPPHAELPFSG
jgi:hypothetical protein